MGLYDSFKDVLSVAQKADNIELYKQLLDLSAQALDLQNENARLLAENIELKKAKSLDDRITYHQTKEVDASTKELPYITLKDDPEEIRYCAICWGKHKRLIPLYDELNCIECREMFKR